MKESRSIKTNLNVVQRPVSFKTAWKMIDHVCNRSDTFTEKPSFVIANHQHAPFGSRLDFGRNAYDYQCNQLFKIRGPNGWSTNPEPKTSSLERGKYSRPGHAAVSCRNHTRGVEQKPRHLECLLHVVSSLRLSH